MVGPGPGTLGRSDGRAAASWRTAEAPDHPHPAARSDRSGRPGAGQPAASPAQPAGEAAAAPAPFTPVAGSMAATAVPPMASPSAAQVPASAAGDLPELPATVTASPSFTPVASSPMAPSGPGRGDPAAVPLGASSPLGSSPAQSPRADVAITPSGTSVPAPAALPSTSPATGTRRAADPLLGPDPDLLPAMPDQPPVAAPTKTETKGATAPAAQNTPTAAPTPAPAASVLPSPVEPAPSMPGAAVAPLPLDPPIQLEPSTSSDASKPASAGLVATTAAPEMPAVARSPGSAGQPASLPPVARDRVDSNVVLTGGRDDKSSRPRRSYPANEQGGPAARVANDVITFHEFQTAYTENLQRFPELAAAIKKALEGELPPADRQNILAQNEAMKRQTLGGLIDRSLIVQEAKRQIKDKKMIDLLHEHADRLFEEEEVAPLLRKYSVDSEAKLRERLADEGRSLDAMKKTFREQYMAQGFVHEKVKDKLKVELPDLLKYYNDGLRDHAFDRPAQTTWREIVVEVHKQKSREAAKAKAEALLARVRAGEDFARIARTESDGLTSSRKEGGLMVGTPGSFADRVINDALAQLPVGKVSDVLEGDNSFYVVRVEKRRPAGPASFAEVQDKIKPLLEKQKFQNEHEIFINKLKRDAIIKLYLND